MRKTLKHVGRLMAALALGAIVSAPAMAAEKGFDAQFKLRTGLQFGSAKDELDRRIMGAGLDFGYQTSFGRFGLELGYQYKSGGEKNTGATGANPGENVIQHSTPQPGEQYLRVGIDKNSLEGIAVRLNYSNALNEDWSYQGGIQLGGARFRHDYLGDIKLLNSAGTTTIWRDSYNGNAIKSTLAISPYIGVTYRINEVSSLELNVIGVNYKSIQYIHVVGTVDGTGPTDAEGGHTSMDFLQEHNRMVPHIEVGYVFRF